jgi:hypothetical protein
MAYQGFVANPSRISSLRSAAASNVANINLMKVFNGGSVNDKVFGQAGSYAYQAAASAMEIAEDNLKAAERGLGFNDDSKAYFGALDAYEAAEAQEWGQTYYLQSKSNVLRHKDREAYVRNYNKAYRAYDAKEPTLASNEAMDLQERSFVAQFMGYNKQPNIERYMDYTSAATKAAYAKRDADKILPAFVERNRDFSQMASLELQGQASQLQGQLQAQQRSQFQQPQFFGGR